jgi:outer membrane protein OmpA-like peptidoglycan-associated protein
MKKSTIFKIAGMLVLAVMLVSCNGLKKMAKNFNALTYEVNPEVLEAKGGKVTFTVTANVPPKFFNRKAAIFFQPVLRYGDKELELTPVMAKGEKIEGEGTTINFENGGTFTYSDEFDFTPDMKAAELMVIAVGFMPKEAVAAGMTMTDAMKMRKAVNLGETKLADGIIATSTRVEVENEVREVIEIGEEVIEVDANGNILIELYQVDIDFTVDLLEIAPHGYEKVTVVSEEANVYFPKNRHNFSANLEWNKKQEVTKQLEDLNEFVRMGWEIKDITIDGWASPEGEETLNEGLSERRSNTAKDILFRNLKKLKKEKESKVSFENCDDISLKSIGHGPDWNGFLKVVEQSSIKDKRPILNVVKSSDPLKREQEIRNMINIYPELEDYILPPLRRAQIVVNCFEPKKTDEEIARLATSNPSALTEAELLYAATLTADWSTQHAIYTSATKNFPQSWKGFNNAAYVGLKLGKIDEAIKNLTTADRLSKNNGAVMNNLGVAYAYKNDFNEAEKYFLNANKMGIDNNYNLGLVDIVKGNYSAAVNKFSGVMCNYNVALAQLLAGNNSAAASNLECARKNAATYYLMAVVGSRTNNEVMMLANLAKAVKANPKYKAEAKIDREFIKYFETPEFQGIVN